MNTAIWPQQRSWNVTMSTMVLRQNDHILPWAVHCFTATVHFFAGGMTRLFIRTLGSSSQNCEPISSRCSRRESSPASHYLPRVTRESNFCGLTIGDWDSWVWHFGRMCLQDTTCRLTQGPMMWWTQSLPEMKLPHGRRDGEKSLTLSMGTHNLMIPGLQHPF